MIISDSRRFVFLHNPKAAGTSIRRALQPYDSRSNFYWKTCRSEVLGRELDKAHMAAEDFRAQFPSDFALLADYFVFMFVRNPYDRAVSAYNETVERRLSVITTPRTMRKYIEALNRFILEKCTPEAIRYDFALRFFIPQEAICVADGKSVADYIGRFEDMEGSLDRIASLAGLPDTAFGKLRRANARNRSFQYEDLLSGDTVAHINAVYRGDFERFGYAQREPVSARDVNGAGSLLGTLRRRLRRRGA
ncbi:MAG: sulfotransferase family 2 domain-containing protein [Alphaproteobacteria bacterium]|nr:sulfotransferase family 2 domain-containing protein [Alphaproteobacteria bacterium]